MKLAVRLIGLALGCSMTTQVTASDFDEGAVVRELQFRRAMIGANQERANADAIAFIWANYGHRVSCEKALFFSVSEIGCSIGLRQVGLVLARLAPELNNPDILGSEEIVVSNSWKATGSRWEGLAIEIPFFASEERVARWLRRHLLDRGRESDRAFVRAFLDRLDQSAQRLGFAIEVDSGIVPLQADRGLRALEEALARLEAMGRRPLRPIESVRLGRANAAALSDDGPEPQMSVSIDSSASVATVVAFLMRPWGPTRRGSLRLFTPPAEDQ